MVGTKKESKMNSDLADFEQLDIMKNSYECKFCRKSFAKETTLIGHLCEKKRRAQQEKEVGVQWGLYTYRLFYDLTQTSKKSKSYQDFSTSPYYTAFVKFGRYCVNVRCVNHESFARWLLKNNKKLDQWTSDKLYEDWLFDYLRREPAQDALGRGIQEIQKYAEDNEDLKNRYKDYFRYANVNRICYHIITGKISPWMIYNCKSGLEFLENLGDDNVKLIMRWIDPDYWNKKFLDNNSDASWAKNILSMAGL